MAGGEVISPPGFLHRLRHDHLHVKIVTFITFITSVTFVTSLEDRSSAHHAIL